MGKAKIWTDSDPWLTKRLARSDMINRGDLALTNAIMTAMSRWLTAATRAIYHLPTRTDLLGLDAADAAITAAGDDSGGAASTGADNSSTGNAPGPAGVSQTSGIPADMLPDLSLWPAARSWQVLIDTVVAPEVSKLFGEAFAEATRDAAIRAQDYAEAYTALSSNRLSQNLWPQTVYEDVRTVIGDGVAQGLSITHITEQLSEVLDADHHAWQARRIARTETMGAVNSGTWNGASAYADITGEEMYKQWYATEDSRTRPDHVDAHKLVVPIAEDFTVGGYKMAHPGDPAGPPSEVCNCRCTLLTLNAREADEWLREENADGNEPPTLDPAAAPITVSPEDLEPSVTGSTLTLTKPGLRAATAYAGGSKTAPAAKPKPPAQSADNGDGADGADVGYWFGVLAPLDTPSADGRMIGMPPASIDGTENLDAAGQPMPRTRPLPLPLLYQDALSDGHAGAVSVGLITGVYVEDGNLMGCGTFDLADPRAAEIARKVASGNLGWISVDLDDTSMEMRYPGGEGGGAADMLDILLDGGGIACAYDWRLMSATLVSQPAFPTAKIVTGRPGDMEPAEPDSELENDDIGVQHALSAYSEQLGGAFEYEFCDCDACEWTEFTDGGRDAWAGCGCGRCDNFGLIVFAADGSPVPPVPSKGKRLTRSMPGRRKYRPHEGATGPQSPNATSAGLTPARAAVLFKVLHPDTGLPVADAGTAWDGSAAAKRLADWAKGSGDEIDPGKYSRGFLYRDDGSDDTNTTAYKLGYCDLIDGRLTIVPKGVYAAAGAVNGARTPLDVPQAQQGELKNAISRLYGRLSKALGDDSIVAPWDDKKAASARVSVAFRLGRQEYDTEEFAPPLAWFQNPSFPSYMNVTVCDDGRIFGHVAPFGQCHVGMSKCVTAPKSPSQYAYFHQGTVRTAEGHDVAVGTVFMGTDHANTRLGMHDAMRHYADTGAAGAVVRAGEDAHGIWIAGAVLPGADLVTLRRAAWSGDWRRIGPAMEMCGVLCVNEPGFPVPRPAWSTDDRGVVCALTAAAGTAPARTDVPSGVTVMDQFVSTLATELVPNLAGELRREWAAERARDKRWAAALARVGSAKKAARDDRFARAMSKIKKGA